MKSLLNHSAYKVIIRVGLMLLLLKSSMTYAQNDTNKVYFKLYDDHLMVSPYLGLGQLTLAFRPQSGSDVGRVNYTSNAAYRAGLGFSYNDISVYVGMGTRISDFNTAYYGLSDATDYSVSLISGGRIIRGSYRSYSGLTENTEFISNPIDVASRLDYRSDLRYRQVHLMYGQFFNSKKFDYNTIVNMAGQHLKSANSFMLQGGYDYYILNADSSWIPSKYRSSYGSTADLTGYQGHSLAISPGWAGIWAGRHWFLMGKINVGLRGTLINGRRPNQSSAYKFEVDADAVSRIVLGYNRPRWYLTMDLDAQSFSTNLDALSVTTTYLQVYYTLGFRFHAPIIAKWLAPIPLIGSFAQSGKSPTY